MRNILICVSGLTPQIVSETYFCLAVKEKIRIDEIYVITTVRGRKVILGEDAAPNTPKTQLKKELNSLCKLYSLSKPKFDNGEKHIIVATEESIELSDIRSDTDNILFPNKVSQFIREKSMVPENVLYCSITGGRKSMSVHIANSLSLFARENDRLLHVLTREENEFKGFYPTNKKEAKDLELSDIPFVRLRSLLSHEIKGENILNLNFDEIVKYTQTQLKLISDKKFLLCDIRKRELTYGNKSISLEPIEFLFYFYFVEMKQRGKNKIRISDITSRETAQFIKELLEKNYPYYYIKDNQQKIFEKGFDSEYFRSKRSKINNKIQSLISDKDISIQFIIEVEKVYYDSSYYIPASLERIKLVLSPF
jgi:CRISPR-associated protein (TIGR02584 family)